MIYIYYIPTCFYVLILPPFNLPFNHIWNRFKHVDTLCFSSQLAQFLRASTAIAASDQHCSGMDL